MASRRKFLGKTGVSMGGKSVSPLGAASLQETVESCKDANWQPIHEKLHEIARFGGNYKC